MLIESKRNVLVDRIMLLAVIALVAWQLLQQGQYHKEALRRHSELTQLELQNQEAFNASIKSSVDDLERMYRQKGKEIEDRKTDPVVKTHP